MRLSALTIVASVGLAVAVWPRLAATQNERDFVFTDDEGHLVLRFAGTEPGGLDANQIEEIVNVQLSTMVHDRLRADAVFEAEPVDSEWAESMEARTEEFMGETAPEFSPVSTECRSASCRLLLGHPDARSVSEHQRLMDRAQVAVREFLRTHPGSFDPVFLIAAHYQEPDKPYLKLFLKKAIRR